MGGQAAGMVSQDVSVAQSAPKALLLLKTQSSPHDGYDDFFGADARFQHTFLPVFEHRIKQDALDQVADTIQQGGFTVPESIDSTGSRGAHGGMIFTSQRAVEAFASVVERLRSAGAHLSALLPPTLPFYVVGPATARLLRALDLPCPVLGEHAGNGEALAAFMLEHFDGVCRARPATPRSLLFMVGEQRRDVIPRMLQDPALPPGRRVRVCETTVYETSDLRTFPEDFAREVGRVRAASPARQWVVVFSPNGCRAVLDGLDLLARDGRVLSEKAADAGRAVRIVTIGPTTRAFLEREFGFGPDACAPTPTPEGILQAILDFGGH